MLPIKGKPLEEWVPDFNPQKENDPQDPLTKVRLEVGQRADLLATKFFKKKVREEEHKSNVPTLEKTSFKSDDYPYILTTEVGQAEALQKVKTYPEKKKGIFLGFAYEFNYHLLAERSTEHAFICDINKRMHMLYKFIAKTIVGCETRADFLQAKKNEFEKYKDIYFGFEDGVERIIDYFKETEYSWLSSDEKFLKIKQLYLDKKIHHLNLDLEKDTKFFEELGTWATDKGYVLDVVYVSNIPEWIKRTGLISAVKENLLKIMAPETVLIDARLIDPKSGPEIHVRSKSDQDFLSFDSARKQVGKGIKRQRSGLDFLTH